MMRALFALLLAACVGLAQAQELSPAELPPEGRETLRLIASGGPFPHKRDGIVFNNYEKRLPQRPRGHYREYTVATPGISHRGARRIVCGGERPTRPEACWYTSDHYKSFRKIRP
jgi:ribonuclease T1